MYRVETFSVADLSELILDKGIWQTGKLPVPKEKILSCVNNPRAEKKDVILIVGYKNDEVAGYLGVIPDKIFFDGEVSKFGWLSSWWVAPSHRKSGLGGILFLKAMRSYANQVGILEFTEDAKQFYDKSQMFVTLKILEGIRLTFRHGSSRKIKSAFGSSKVFQVFSTLLEFCVDGFVTLKFELWRSRNDSVGDINLEYLTEIDEETLEFIKKNRKEELSFRDAEELNWILKYPWKVSAPLGDRRGHRYYFSPYVGNFACYGIKIFNKNNSLIGFLILKAQGNGLEMPYGVFRAGHSQEIWTVVVEHIIRLRLKSFRTFHPELVNSITNKNIPYIRIKKVSRSCYISKVFEGRSFDDLHLQDGEGDSAF